MRVLLDTNVLIDYISKRDFLQMECAIDYNANYIITRNIKDYKNSSVQPILPSDFLKIYKNRA